jgi:uncharacterized protein (TIGR02246 family)
MNRHRLVLAGLILLGAGAFVGLRTLIPAQAQVPPATGKTTPEIVPQTPKAPAAGSAEAGIKKITEEYVKAFNTHDAKATASLWTDEGEYTGADGKSIVGRTAIEKSLADEFKAHPKATIAIQVGSVRALGRQTAMAEGVVKVNNPGEAEASETRYSALHVLEDGRWHAASVREWVPAPGFAAATKFLEWLVGDWTAKGERGNIAISYAWGDENKTFLIGKYSISKDGKMVSTGTQGIGRNSSGGLRSWMFDSTGIFNTAMWQREGSRWVDEATGMLPDGTEVNSVSILIPLGQDAFTWHTTERSSDGVPLPPLPPIKVTRVKPNK